MAELADALRSGRSSLYGSVGSTPTIGTQKLRIFWAFLIQTRNYLHYALTNWALGFRFFAFQGISVRDSSNYRFVYMADTQSSQLKPQTQTKPRRTRQLSSTQVMFAVILAIALMLAVQFSSRINDERNLNQIRNTVEQEIDLLRHEQSELIEQLEFVESDAYVEQWAHGEGRMVRDNMVLVIPIPSLATIQQELIEQTLPVEQIGEIETTLPDPESWQLWWALFFDMQAPQFGT